MELRCKYFIRRTVVLVLLGQCLSNSGFRPSSIEHLYPETLDNTPYNIFGQMRPKVVALSTPNVEINCMFEMTTAFRHWDHKFEWSRQQFEDW